MCDKCGFVRSHFAKNTEHKIELIEYMSRRMVLDSFAKWIEIGLRE